MPVRPTGFLTAPESHPVLSPDGWHPSEPLAENATVAAFLGYRPDAQLADPGAWQTLLSLHNDDSFGLEIVDVGAYTVLIPTGDLRAGTFHRTVCAIQSC
ncbi:DUF1963 domain-containing protein [Solirubrobacter ginsenosidimutans]|uniref:DUF1963 domain-containing protein n=1 Tax=Solirubrobacter ginsenosidimutans TaxID=490573 RepID=A0A9X3MMG2_9ACTN|nr:DUF1963 domain-containing protein [Solirubrobacter ginsenosidimutans]